MADVIYSLLFDLGLTGTSPLSVKEVLVVCIFAFALSFIADFIAIITDFGRK